MAKTPPVLHGKKRLTIAEAAQYLSAIGEPVSEADVLGLALDEALQLSVQFLDTIYGEYKLENGAKDLIRLPLSDGEVFDLPMIGAARLAVEEARLRYMGQTDVVFNHSDAILVDEDLGGRFELYHRPGDYSPVTRLPEHARLLVRREVLEQVAHKMGGKEPVERPVGTRERDTLYLIIAALCRQAGLDLRQPGKVAEAIGPATKHLTKKDPIPPRTVQFHLKAVRERYGER